MYVTRNHNIHGNILQSFKNLSFIDKLRELANDQTTADVVSQWLIWKRIQFVCVLLFFQKNKKANKMNKKISDTYNRKIGFINMSIALQVFSFAIYKSSITTCSKKNISNQLFTLFQDLAVFAVIHE